MLITFSNEITINDYTPELLKYIEEHLTLANPEYEKKQRLGFYIGNTPRKICLYKTRGTDLIIPIGAFAGLKPLLKDYDVKLDLACTSLVDYQANVGLYPYQEKAVEYMSKKGYGILKSPAGSGKTQMGIALICKLGHKALWLTHTQDLLAQSYERASRYIDKSLLGTITEGKVNIGAGITFATVQTLSKQDLTQYKYEWDVIVVDECHRVAGTPTAMTQFSKVISSLACMYKYGLSATVHRADGFIKSTYALIGDVKYSVPESEVADKIMKVRIEKVKTTCGLYEEALDTDGTLDYSKYLSCIAEDTERNKLIADLINKNQNHYNLVLCDRLSQMEEIQRYVPDAIIITGKTKKALREQALENMREGKSHTLLATYKLAKEGLDIPILDRLYLASPQKDYAVIVQSVGRIARTFDGKGEPICYDIVDKTTFAENCWKKRVTNYKKCNCISDYF